MADHSDRIIFAIDSVFAGNWMKSHLPTVSRWWGAIEALSPEAAHAIAHGNAERLWNLEPKPDSFTVSRPNRKTLQAARAGGGAGKPNGDGKRRQQQAQ